MCTQKTQSLICTDSNFADVWMLFFMIKWKTCVNGILKSSCTHPLEDIWLQDYSQFFCRCLVFVHLKGPCLWCPHWLYLGDKECICLLCISYCRVGSLHLKVIIGATLIFQENCVASAHNFYINSPVILQAPCSDNTYTGM